MRFLVRSWFYGTLLTNWNNQDITAVRDGYIIGSDGPHYLYLLQLIRKYTLNVRSVEEIAQQKKGELVSASKENAQNLGKLVISVSWVTMWREKCSQSNSRCQAVKVATGQMMAMSSILGCYFWILGMASSCLMVAITTLFRRAYLSAENCFFIYLKMVEGEKWGKTCIALLSSWLHRLIQIKPIPAPVTPALSTLFPSNSDDTERRSLVLHRKSRRYPLRAPCWVGWFCLWSKQNYHRTEQRVVYPHGDHFHFIPYSVLSP